MSQAYGTSSMVCGILALILCWIPYFSIPLGILSIIFFAVSKKKRENTGMAVAGLVTGIIGTVIGAVLFVFALLVVAAVSTL